MNQSGWVAGPCSLACVVDSSVTCGLACHNCSRSSESQEWYHKVIVYDSGMWLGPDSLHGGDSVLHPVSANDGRVHLVISADGADEGQLDDALLLWQTRKAPCNCENPTLLVHA